MKYALIAFHNGARARARACACVYMYREQRGELTGTGTTANIIRGESSHRRVKGFILLSVRDEFVLAVK